MLREDSKIPCRSILEDSRTSTDQSRGREDRVSSSNGGSDIELRRVQGDQSKSIVRATVGPQAHAESAIIITNLTARPSLLSRPALVKVDIRLRLSTINVLTGPIGSGKSTLSWAIFGELPLDTGSIFVSSNNMAHCAQTPWILNIPIQKSVSGLTRGQSNQRGLVQQGYARLCSRQGHAAVSGW
jgi:ABC-type glutathione transport system ATPase component